MKKIFTYYLICWAILVAMFNGVVFLLPKQIAGVTTLGGAFWPGYVFITLALLGQLLCAYVAFKAENQQKFFYRWPLISISYTATIVSAVVGALAMVIPGIPNWLGAILCVLILGFSAIALLSAKTAANVVGDIDDKIQVQTFFIKSLTTDVQALMMAASSDDMRTEIKKVYEAVRYSDPMSQSALAGIEAQITLKFQELSQAVGEQNLQGVQTATQALLILVDNRNKQCRLLK